MIDTPTSIAMAIHVGMQEYALRIGKRLRFVLDEYKKGLADWRKE